jgi:NAD-dependent deacetylase
VEHADQTEAVKGWIDTAQRVVVLTGAGISTDSGIPDFRGPQGVWTKNPGAERRATIDNYLQDPEVRRRSWQDRLDSAAWKAEPNAGHRALVVLERRGKLHTLITQNIDGLHQRAGTDPERMVEIHGTIHWTVCMSCGDRRPMSEVLERVKAGEPDPPCLAPSGATSCGGIL